MGEVSGGERRRLQLLRLLMTEPNVLLLDEPTNDLDTDTLAAVEDILDSFPGTLVVVSHDRYLLERVTDHQVALLGDGGVRDLPGGVGQYLRLRRDAVKVDDAVRVRGGEPAGRGPGGPARSAGSAGQAVDALHGRLEAVSADPTRADELAGLGRQLAAAQTSRAELETQWLEAAEVLEP